MKTSKPQHSRITGKLILLLNETENKNHLITAQLYIKEEKKAEYTKSPILNYYILLDDRDIQ